MALDERVCVYIDGFNLYFGMTSSCPKLKWLDIECQIILASQLP